MITWMQRHRKYMMVVMWVAVITFIGAGAVEWGGSSYGKGAGNVATVGEVEIDARTFQIRYNQAFRAYSQRFKGNFDEKKAEELQLKQYVLNSLIQDALVENLARSFDMQVPTKEVQAKIQSMESFQKDGKFDIELYKSLLKSNGYTNKMFEKGIQNEISSIKVNQLLTTKALPAEQGFMQTIAAIANKVEYLVIDDKNIKVDVKESDLKAFWELQKSNYMTEARMKVEYIKEPITTETFSDKDIEKHFRKNSFKYLDAKGVALTMEQAKPQIIAELSEKSAQNRANLHYAEWKKGTLNRKEVTILTKTFTSADNPFSDEVTQTLQTLTPKGNPSKAIKDGAHFIVVKLVEQDAPRIQTFQEAKAMVLPKYIASKKREKLQALAEERLKSFKGKTTDFIKKDSTVNFSGLNPQESNIALSNVFSSTIAQAHTIIHDSKAFLFRIKEQKLLFNNRDMLSDIQKENLLLTLKENSKNSLILQELEKQYEIQRYIK